MLETALEPIDDDIGDSAAEARANGAESDQRGVPVADDRLRGL